MSTLIEQLADQMRQIWPDAHVEIDPPDTATGIWWIHASIARQRVEVEWRQTQGFGVSVCDEASMDDAFSGPTTIVTSATDVIPAIERSLSAPSLAAK